MMSPSCFRLARCSMSSFSARLYSLPKIHLPSPVPLSRTVRRAFDGVLRTQCDLDANEGILTAMVASAGEVHYALHSGSARGAPKLISPAVTEEGADFGAWLGARCVLVRCAMPMQLRLYGMKVGGLGANAVQPCAAQAVL